MIDSLVDAMSRVPDPSLPSMDATVAYLPVWVLLPALIGTAIFGVTLDGVLSRGAENDPGQHRVALVILLALLLSVAVIEGFLAFDAGHIRL